MPAQRVRQAQGAIKSAFHPYKLRPSRKYTRENMARDQPAEKLKHKKTSQEQALHILDNKELKDIPVQQLRRLAGVKKIQGWRKQSIMLSFRRIYGDRVPLYPSEGRVEMRECTREEYQIGERKVVKIDAYQEVVIKEEALEEISLFQDYPSLRRSSRLKERVPPLADQLPVAPSESRGRPRRKG